MRLAGFLATIGAAAVIGGLAMIARVRPRTTDDLDVIVTATGADVPRILEAARACGYQWKEKDVPDFVEMGLLRLESPVGKGGYGVDLILADSPLLARVVERATPVPFAGAALPVASIEDLVILKLDANRPVDIDDLMSIKDAFGASLDYRHIEEWTGLLQIRDRLKLYFGR